MTAAVARTQRVSQRQSTASRRTAGNQQRRTRPQAQRTNKASIVRPQLKVLDQQAVRRRARRRNMAMTLFVVVIVGFFAAALAQAQLVANQHELDLLRTQIAEAEANRARLERQVEESSAPSAIINRAQEIGMVRANDPIYLAATTSAPTIKAISTIGSATATTEALSGAEVEIEMAQSVDVAGPIVGPVVATVAGTRAVTTGVGTG